MKGASCTADFPWTAIQQSGQSLGFFQHTILAAANTPDACYNKNCRKQVQALIGLSDDDGCGSSSPANTIAVASFFVFALFAFVLMF